MIGLRILSGMESKGGPPRTPPPSYQSHILWFTSALVCSRASSTVRRAWSHAAWITRWLCNFESSWPQFHQENSMEKLQFINVSKTMYAICLIYSNRKIQEALEKKNHMMYISFTVLKSVCRHHGHRETERKSLHKWPYGSSE